MQIIVQDACVRFGSRIVFDGFSAVFDSGRVTALTGPSGSGKSSLLAAMAGYQKLDSGTVAYYDGTDTLAPDASLIAWVLQGSNALGTRTALDNVMIGPLSEGRPPAEARNIARGALNDVGMLPRADQRARVLSGGELQRVSFARALATSKPLIFADEPSASLDGPNTELLGSLLARVRARATIIVATHDPLLIDAAETIVSLRQDHAHAA